MQGLVAGDAFGGTEVGTDAEGQWDEGREHDPVVGDMKDLGRARREMYCPAVDVGDSGALGVVGDNEKVPALTVAAGALDHAFSALTRTERDQLTTLLGKLLFAD